MDDDPVDVIAGSVQQPDVVDLEPPSSLNQVAVAASTKLGQTLFPFNKEFAPHEGSEPAVIISSPRRHDLVMQFPGGGLHHLRSEHRVVEYRALG